MQFYDENTSGRILNRLSSDIRTVDNIVFDFLEMIDYIIKCAFSVFFIMFSNPILILVVLAQLYYFSILRKTVLHVTRDCFRLKQTLNSPIVSLIQDSINGQVTMRTLG
jgi:ABC-type multidrug transport system fused ATPase/permease subunit